MTTIVRSETQNDSRNRKEQFTSYRGCRPVLCLIIGVFFGEIQMVASAAEITLSWEPADDPNVISYEVFYGSKEQSNEVKVPVSELANPSEPRYTVDNLEAGQTYFFAVREFDSKGKKAGLSAGFQEINLAENGGVKDISLRLKRLEDVITPEGASEILNVARIKQEILEREKYQTAMTQKLVAFDERLSKTVSAFESRIANTEGRIDSLLYWIFGGLIGVIGALIYIVQALLKSRALLNEPDT